MGILDLAVILLDRLLRLRGRLLCSFSRFLHRAFRFGFGFLCGLDGFFHSAFGFFGLISFD